MPSARKQIETRLSGLKRERSSFIGHWRELSDFQSPRRGRFLTTDRNKGDKRYGKIINARATMALRTCVAGMMAGITSPARPWLRLETPDPDMMEYEPVKLWLAGVERRMYDIFSQSNLYNSLPTVYREMALFGTGNVSADDDFEDVLRFSAHTAGSYMVANNKRGMVDTHYREFEMTVAQMVEDFGLDACSVAVRNLYDKGSLDEWVPVVHAIEPNDDRDIRLKDSRNKPWRSVYYEPGRNDDSFLRVSGFDEFPNMVPRWERTGEDVYGTDCPGMTALGDVKALQVEEKRKAQAIDKMVNPPLDGPASLRNVPISSLPGGATLYGDGNETRGLKPIYEVRAPIGDMRADMDALEMRINEAFYVPVFFAISSMEGVQPRNVMELAERKAEALLQLGPMLQNVHGDLLDPLVDRTFNRMAAVGMLPPAPEELQGAPLKVEYISVLAQAQRAIGTEALDRLGGYIGGLAEASGDLSVWDKFDKDQAIDEYAHMIGVPPKIVVSDEDAAEKRAGRAQQEQMMQMAEMAKPAADAMGAAKTAQEIANGAA